MRCGETFLESLVCWWGDLTLNELRWEARAAVTVLQPLEDSLSENPGGLREVPRGKSQVLMTLVQLLDLAMPEVPPLHISVMKSLFCFKSVCLNHLSLGIKNNLADTERRVHSRTG